MLTLLLFHRAAYRPGSIEQTVDSLSRLPVLLEHAHAQGLDPDADMLDEIERALLRWPGQVRMLLDEARSGDEGPTLVPGGAKCPTCGSRLRMSPGWDLPGAASNARAHCPLCRDDDGELRSWPAEEWLPKERDDLVTADEAAGRFGIARDTVYQWRRRGRIKPRGVDDYGSWLFRADDITARLNREHPGGTSDGDQQDEA